MPPTVVNALRSTAFAALLLAAAAIREGPVSVIDQAIVWLPSGVAVAGVFLLGPRAAWIVAATTLLQRWFLGYDWTVGLSGAAGSTCEAVLGAFILRRLGLRHSIARLRDVGAVLATAAIAPLGSIVFSWLGRMWLWTQPDMPFYSGWDGWWRMNALAIIMIVPVTLTWLDLPRGQVTRRLAWGVVGGTTAIACGVPALMMVLPGGATGAMWLNLVLLAVVLSSAAWFGMRGATLATTVSGLVVVIVTSYGHGPFLSLDRPDRHVALQLFELAIVALPPAFAAIIAERQVAEAAGRHSEGLLESINRNVQEGLFRVDHAMAFVYANAALVRMFGGGVPEELAGRSLDEAFADSLRRTELLGLLREQDEVLNEEVLFRRPDGTTFWGLVSGKAERDASGVIVHYDGAIADITARKALEEQVRQAQKMEAVGKLAGGIAHDFNNLLTVIIGYAEALRDAVRSDAAAREHAEAVMAAGRRAALLTGQLLAYSRRQMLAPQILAIDEVVDGIAGMLQRIIGEDIRLVVEHRSGPCWVRVDRSQLEQVLLNLAVNARDAMQGGGTLTLSTGFGEVEPADAYANVDRVAGPCAMIRAHDTGVGMTRDVLERAFDPFFTTKAPGQGTGLGLATVYGIVKQSGGAIWLESTPGEGTTACIGLPSCNGPGPVADTPPQPVHTSRAATVLVVEDEPAVRALVIRTLARRGHRVLEADDGARAIDVAQVIEGRLDLVVTDVIMPVMGGREMARRMSARWPSLRYLFMSGYSDSAVTPEALAGPEGDFLTKPFSPDELLLRVDALLSVSAPGTGAGRPTAIPGEDTHT